MDYYANSQWTDRVPLLLQSLLVEAFEKSGRIAAVGRETAGIRADYVLETEIRDFEAYYAVPDAAPNVRANITANDNDISRNLQNGSSQTVSSLNTYSGTDFDRQYINSQVGIHQWLLNTLDNTLIPSAHNRQLRDFLKAQRTAVATHLDRARQIQSNLR